MELVTFDQNSNIQRVFIPDCLSPSGVGLTALTSGSIGLSIGTLADVESNVVAYVQSSGTIEGITTIGTYVAPTANKCRFKEVSATYMPGWYEIQFSDARFSVANAKYLDICVFGPANAVQINKRVQLPLFDIYSATPNVNVSGYSSGQAPLQPTITGRTLDVSTGGEAGIDWSNIGSPTSTIIFSNTIVSGIINQVTVSGYLSGFAPLQPTVAGRTLDISTGGEAGIDWGNIGSPTFTNNLTNTSISGVNTAVTVSGYTTGNVPLKPTVAGRDLDVSSGGEAGIDWNNIGSPTTLVNLTNTAISGINNAVTVGTNNDKTGYRLSATGVDDVWDETQSGHTSVGTFGKYLDSQISTIASSVATSGQIAYAVWDELQTNHTNNGSFGKYLDSQISTISATIASSGQIANAVWDTLRSAHTINGSFGQGILIATSGIVSSSFGISAIDANAIAPDAITSSELATTAANEIRDAVTDMFPGNFSNMTIYSDGSVNASGISGQGVGSNILSIYLYNSNGDIIGGGRVDIRASGTNTFLDTGVSNSSTGRVDFNLDDGQYSIYAYKNSMTHWTNPLYINLTTSTSVNYSGVALTVNPPASNNLVRVYSYIEDLGLDPVAGVEMTFKPSGVQFFDNTLVTGDSLIATTDGDGFVYGDIAGGIGYRVQIPAANYSTWVVTPSSGIVNILDL